MSMSCPTRLSELFDDVSRPRFTSGGILGGRVSFREESESAEELKSGEYCRGGGRGRGCGISEGGEGMR